MAETKTLSKVERFALVAAREQIQNAQATFNSLITEIAAVRGVDQATAPNWQFTRDFSAMIYVPKPKVDKGEPTPDVLPTT